MNTLAARFALVLAFALLLLLVVTVPVTVAAPSLALAPALIVDGDGTDSPIHARRNISIPYSITSATLLHGERTVEVTGHGGCTEAWTSYRVRVTVRQEESGAEARSLFTDQACSDEWSVVARLLGPDELMAGTAEICAMALIERERNGTIPYQWCKSIEVE